MANPNPDTKMSGHPESSAFQQGTRNDLSNSSGAIEALNAQIKDLYTGQEATKMALQLLTDQM